MKYRTIMVTGALLALWSSEANATTLSNIVGIPVIVNIVILAGAIACLTIGVRLLSLVKGGALAKGWLLWVISFSTLVAAQIVILAERLDLFKIGVDIAAVFYLATVTLWFVGLMQTRKVLE